MSNSRILPLDGVRILDLTTIVFGSYATQLLGDFGADVIKIEAPGGDTTRSIGPARSPGMASLFLGLNRNKRSLELDLKREAARAALWRLVEGADMFVHNMRPAKMAGLGFDPDSVLGRNRAIVYGGLHGYLEEGPYGARPAYDDVIQGECGIAGTFTARDGEPTLVPTVLADKSSALLATNALMAAMIQKLRTGKGLYVEVAMFETMVGYTMLEHLHGATFSPPTGGIGYPRLLTPERRPFATADGHLCMLAYTDRQWAAFWRLAGEPDHARDPRFTTMRARSENIEALYALAGAALSRRATGEWLTALRDAEIPAGPVNRLDDLEDDEQLRATGFFRPFDHPSEGAITVPDTGVRLDRQPLPVRRHAPGLGEQGAEILREAGFSDAQIEKTLAR